MSIKFADHDRIFEILRKSEKIMRLEKKYGAEKAKDETAELTIAFVDIAESAVELVDKLFPALFQKNLAGEALDDLLEDIFMAGNHILYHMVASQLFREAIWVDIEELLAEKQG